MQSHRLFALLASATLVPLAAAPLALIARIDHRGEFRVALDVVDRSVGCARNELVPDVPQQSGLPWLTDETRFRNTFNFTPIAPAPRSDRE